MTFPASQIALLINGKVAGNPDVAVSAFGKIEEAKEGQLTFFANPKYEDYLYSTAASIIIINEEYELKQPIKATLIKVPDAYTAFATLLGKYQEIIQQQLSGIQEPSYISKTAIYGQQVFIGAFAYLGENVTIGNNTKIFPNVYLGDQVTVGDNTVIHPGVRIYQGCKVGSNVIIHAGTVIGSDGFGFAPQANGSLQKVPQIGNVVIEDNVEIGANAAIDRATIGSTLIKSGAKLDNLIQIAHNVEVGHSTVIAAQAGISGSNQALNARRNYMMSWPQYAREQAQRSELLRQGSAGAQVRKELPKVEWSTRTTALRKTLDDLYAKFREALRQSPAVE